VRISGPDALAVAGKVFSPRAGGAIRQRRLYYGTVAGRVSGALDDGYMVYMAGPATYTGEDVVELYCHGSPLVLKEVLAEVFQGGARPSTPGEFTKRAFLNGKMDLAEAEAVGDLIGAETETALESARARLKGGLSKRVNALKEGLIDLLARLEAELDFPDDFTEALPDDHIADRLRHARDGVVKLLSTYEEGRVRRDGASALILGRPNVGKSSLFNALLDEERAIVAAVAGTTRDVIEETSNVRGLGVRLMDTAGLRDTVDPVESLGVEAARRRINGAGLVLFVVDASGDLGPDAEIFKSLEGKKAIVAANKADLMGEDAEAAARSAFDGYRVIFTSALLSTGIEALKDAIYEEALGVAAAGDDSRHDAVASLRHKDALEKALEGVEAAIESLGDGLGREFTATDIKWSLDRMGEITGETTPEDVLDRIFSRFCIGK
jgi:tRNA modification GTPase